MRTAAIYFWRILVQSQYFRDEEYFLIHAQSRLNQPLNFYWIELSSAQKTSLGSKKVFFCVRVSLGDVPVWSKSDHLHQQCTAVRSDQVRAGITDKGSFSFVFRFIPHILMKIIILCNICAKHLVS